ncbi:MAG: prolipoprotein diacylglyceryl transferase [Anaerolineales bacterium]|nr:prolipoprotein diacylglyceryl transferase [Anaerolineales bacterium]
MFPTVVVGAWQVGVYPVVYALAFVIAAAVAYVRLLPLPIPRRELESFILWCLAGAVAGLVVGPVWSAVSGFVQPAAPDAHPEPMRIYFVGAGLLLAGLLYARLRHFPFLLAADRACCVFALGYAIARIGCFAAGCCGGKPTDAFWGMYMPDEAGVWAVRYPTQIMSGVLQLATFVGLFLYDWQRGRWRKGRNYPFVGFVFLLAVMLVAGERFLVEFFRADSVAVWGALSVIHLGMVGIMGVAALGMVVGMRGRRSY